MSQTTPRVWEIHAERFRDNAGRYDEAAFRDAGVGKLVELETMGHNLGGGFVVRPLRAETDGGMWHTVGWRFNWQSYTPRLQPEPERESPGPECEYCSGQRGAHEDDCPTWNLEASPPLTEAELAEAESAAGTLA